MTIIDELKKNLDEQIQSMTETHGQDFAKEQAAKYLDEMDDPDKARMSVIVHALLDCPQIDFYRLWYPIVDLCLIKNFKVYNHVDSSLGHVTKIVEKIKSDG